MDIPLPGGLTPLHICAENGQRSAVSAMLAVEAGNGNGAAAEAAVAATTDTVPSGRTWTKEEVKERVERRSDEGYRAVDLAAVSKDRETLDLILAKMREVGAELSSADTADGLLKRWEKGPLKQVSESTTDGESFQRCEEMPEMQ